MDDAPAPDDDLDFCCFPLFIVSAQNATVSGQSDLSYKCFKTQMTRRSSGLNCKLYERTCLQNIEHVYATLLLVIMHLLNHIQTQTETAGNIQVYGTQDKVTFQWRERVELLSHCASQLC